jgi:hypothetical protein
MNVKRASKTSRILSSKSWFRELIRSWPLTGLRGGVNPEMEMGLEFCPEIIRTEKTLSTRSPLMETDSEYWEGLYSRTRISRILNSSKETIL